MTPGAAQRRDSEARSPARRRRADDHHRVVLDVDVGEHAPHQPIEPLQRRDPLRPELCGGGEIAVEVGAQHVGTLHQHDAPGRPRVGERVVRGVEVHAYAERPARRVLEQLAPDHPARHLAVAGHERVDRGALVLGQRVVDDGLRAVGVGDHRTRLPRTREGVAERSEARIEQAVGVLLLQRGDAEVHDLAVGVAPRALVVHLGRGGLAVGLGGLERLRGEWRPRRCAPARADGGVARRRRRALARRAGDHVAERRLGEQRLQVRDVGGLDVAPRHRGQRDDEHAPHGGVLRSRGRRGRRSRRGADEEHHRAQRRDERDHAPRRPAHHSSAARSGSAGSNAASNRRPRLGSSFSIAK